MNIHAWGSRERFGFMVGSLVVAIAIVALTAGMTRPFDRNESPAGEATRSAQPVSNEGTTENNLTDHQLDETLEYLETLERIGVE